MENTEQINESSLKQLARYKQYLEHTPDNLDLLLDAIALAVKLQAWEESEPLIEKALERHPQSPKIQAHAGFQFIRQNKLPEAEACYIKAIDGGLVDTGVIYNLAFSRFLQRKFSEASGTLSKIEEKNEYIRERVLLNARCSHHSENMEEALNELNAYLDTHENDNEIEGLLSLMLSDNGNEKEAMAHANKVLGDDPKQQEALLSRAELYIRFNDYNKAFSDFQTITESYPQNGRAWSGLAQVQFSELQFDQAELSLEHAVRHMSDHIGTWHLMGWTNLMKNNLETAKESFEKAYAIDRRFGETHGGLASVYALMGNTKKSEKHIKLAEKLDPTGYSAIYAKMVILNSSGKTKEAKELFEITKNTESPILGTTLQHLLDKKLNQIKNNSETVN